MSLPERSPLTDLSPAERLNFLLTNRIPRRFATQLVGRLSRIESPTFTRLGIRLWQLFGGDLSLHESEQTSFRSLQECFTRSLKPGLRPIAPGDDVITSPCDAIVGACGLAHGTTVYQTKGFPYTLGELLPDDRLVDRFRGGRYVTLRLRSNMYHRFHAPADCRVRRLSYVSGDTWNVNPVALKRVERLFCRNERAILELELARSDELLALVPVAAILVASMRFTFTDEALGLTYAGPETIDCDATVSKGDELGRFLLGSTIVVFAPASFRLGAGLLEGTTIRMGEPLLTRG